MEKIKRKSLLYKTEVEYGDYTVNHVLGCQHGCTYPCYAFSMSKRFGNVKTYKDWITPKLVSNALELLDYEIPRLKSKIKSVQLCFTTDPFMNEYPEVGEMSISIIHRLNEDNIKAIILTKSILPKELESTSKINEYGITLVSLNELFREKYEPFTSKYDERIHALKVLHDKGYRTWVSIEPYPTPNICKQNLDEILESISFVDYIVFGRMHYNKEVTNYKEHRTFYNQCVAIVESFCKNKGIKYHIKKGTKTE